MKKIIKKIGSIVKKPTFWIALLVLITSVVFIPALKMEFWWVDDGWDIMIAKKITDSIVHFNLNGLDIVFNEPGGRFRIVYWFYQTFEYWIGGLNPTMHFFIHYLVILISVLFIFRIVLRLSKSNLSAFVSSVLYLLSPINTENLFRLGPQEPLLGLFMLASINFLIERKTLLSVFFLLLTALTKENGFVLWIPILFLYIGKMIFLKKRDTSLEKYCLWGLVFSVPFILNTFLRHGGYSSFYTFDIRQIMVNFRSYIYLINDSFSPIFIIFITTYFIRLIIYLRIKKFKNLRLGILIQLMFMILFLTFILVQSPWGFVLNRYTMPATVGLVIFMGLEIGGIINMLQLLKFRWNILVYVVLGVYIITFIWMNMAHAYLSGQLSSHQTRFIKSLNVTLAKDVPPNGLVLLNFIKGDSTVELVDEIGLHLKLFYHRPDIRVEYLDLKNLPNEKYKIVGTPQITEGYSQQLIEKSIGNYKENRSLVQRDEYLVLTTPINMFKQGAKKAYQFLFYKKPLTADGIYTFYICHDYWYTYDAGK